MIPLWAIWDWVAMRLMRMIRGRRLSRGRRYLLRGLGRGILRIIKWK